MPTIRKRNSPPPENSLDVKGYQEFLSGLELAQLGLTSCSTTIKRDAFFTALLERSKPSRKLTQSYKLADFSPKHFDGEGTFKVMVANQAGETVLSMECVYTAHIHGKSPLRREFAERFCKVELALVLTPYARALVSDLTARMMIPPMILPLTTR